MIMRKRYLIGLLLSVSLASCQKDDITGPVELRLSDELQVEMETVTRGPLEQAGGSGSHFKQNKQVGVFIFENSSLTTGKTGYNDGKCIETKADGNGNLSFVSPATVYFWPSSGYGLKLYGWYPLAAVPKDKANGATDCTFTVQTNQNNDITTSDLMFGYNEDAKRNTGFVEQHKASIPFSHMLTRIQVVLTNGQGLTIDDMTGSIITLGTNSNSLKNKVNITAGLATSNPTISTDATSVMGAPLQITSSYAVNGTNAYAIIPPQNLNGKTLTVQLPASKGSGILQATLTQDLSAYGSFSGKAVTFKVTVNLTELQVTTSIGPWGDGGSKDINSSINNP